MKILTLNCGSSSIKFKIFAMPESRVLVKGQADRIGNDDGLIQLECQETASLSIQKSISSHQEALEFLLGQKRINDDMLPVNTRDITAAGHRFVHGGEFFRSSVIVDKDVRKTLETCRSLAPLHNPHNLTGIDVCSLLIPNIPQVAVFDTAFHQSIPDFAYNYALPYRYYEENRIRKYGFHGISHRYVAGRACEILGVDMKSLRIITAHLGNGSSLCAVADGKSLDTTMGFTPLAGVVMGTRSGDIDPALVAHLISNMNLSADEAMHILNHESGVLGISGLSSDFRDLETAASRGHERANLALKVFAYSVARGIGSLIPAMGGLDAIAFTAGIGENSPQMRSRICSLLEWLKVELDPVKNFSVMAEGDISMPNAQVRVLIIPTDEEKMIAQETMNVLR